jgi:hypothetical protein
MHELEDLVSLLNIKYLGGKTKGVEYFTECHYAWKKYLYDNTFFLVAILGNLIVHPILAKFCITNTETFSLRLLSLPTVTAVGQNKIINIYQFIDL